MVDPMDGSGPRLLRLVFLRVGSFRPLFLPLLLSSFTFATPSHSHAHTLSLPLAYYIGVSYILFNILFSLPSRLEWLGLAKLSIHSSTWASKCLQLGSATAYVFQHDPEYLDTTIEDHVNLVGRLSRTRSACFSEVELVPTVSGKLWRASNSCTCTGVQGEHLATL